MPWGLLRESACRCAAERKLAAERAARAAVRADWGAKLGDRRKEVRPCCRVPMRIRVTGVEILKPLITRASAVNAGGILSIGHGLQLTMRQ